MNMQQANIPNIGSSFTATIRGCYVVSPDAVVVTLTASGQAAIFRALTELLAIINTSYQAFRKLLIIRKNKKEKVKKRKAVVSEISKNLPSARRGAK